MADCLATTVVAEFLEAIRQGAQPLAARMLANRDDRGEIGSWQRTWQVDLTSRLQRTRVFGALHACGAMGFLFSTNASYSQDPGQGELGHHLRWMACVPASIRQKLSSIQNTAIQGDNKFYFGFVKGMRVCGWCGQAQAGL